MVIVGRVNMEPSIGDSFLINITDILTYVGTGLRPYKEGERVFKANHVIFCGITKQNSNETRIFALCLKSTALHDRPHEVNIEISKSS